MPLYVGIPAALCCSSVTSLRFQPSSPPWVAHNSLTFVQPRMTIYLYLCLLGISRSSFALGMALLLTLKRVATDAPKTRSASPKHAGCCPGA
jgi:hypothetical protein